MPYVVFFGIYNFATGFFNFCKDANRTTVLIAFFNYLVAILQYI